MEYEYFTFLPLSGKDERVSNLPEFLNHLERLNVAKELSFFLPKISKDIFSAIAFLHSNDIAHRDRNHPTFSSVTSIMQVRTFVFIQGLRNYNTHMVFVAKFAVGEITLVWWFAQSHGRWYGRWGGVGVGGGRVEGGDISPHGIGCEILYTIPPPSYNQPDIFRNHVKSQISYKENWMWTLNLLFNKYFQQLSYLMF